MKPILTKLPDNVQGTWQRHAYRYKVQWSVEYPPFSEFARFIQDIGRERNDPYMATETSKTGNPQPPKPAFRPARNSNLRQVLVSKVDVSGSAPNQSPANDDPSKWCVVHKKPHPLAKCRAFRSKPLDERISLLRQHGVCLRCVATCTHFAKDYKASVQCAECQSERHITALHAGPPSKLDTLDSEQHGWELNSVTTRCTDVCGNMAGGKFCSKMSGEHLY